MEKFLLALIINIIRQMSLLDKPTVLLLITAALYFLQQLDLTGINTNSLPF